MAKHRVVDHRKNFEARRQRLPDITKYLIDLVMTRILPRFEERGFVWYPDFAGGRPINIGSNEIPLQRRQGENWPTVQIRFDRRDRPCFSVDFAVLPPTCRQLGLEPIPRESAQDKAVGLLPVMFDLFDNGIPQEWLQADFGRVAHNVYLMGSWSIWERRRAKKARENALKQ